MRVSRRRAVPILRATTPASPPLAQRARLSSTERTPLDRNATPCRPQASRWQFCRTLAELPGGRRTTRIAFPRTATAPGSRR